MVEVQQEEQKPCHGHAPGPVLIQLQLCCVEPRGSDEVAWVYVHDLIRRQVRFERSRYAIPY